MRPIYSHPSDALCLLHEDSPRLWLPEDLESGVLECRADSKREADTGGLEGEVYIFPNASGQCNQL